MEVASVNKLEKSYLGVGWVQKTICPETAAIIVCNYVVCANAICYISLCFAVIMDRSILPLYA